MIDMVPGGPIVTFSFGEERTFRLTRSEKNEKAASDFSATNGAEFVLPFDTNRDWKRGVP